MGMSLPSFSTQQSLFGVGSLAAKLFGSSQRYRLFADKIWPRLVAARAVLETMYCAHNGRPAAEPVVMMGVSLLQFLDRVPDRQAMELLTLHLGWKLALHRDLDQGAYDPSLLTYFRDRVVQHAQAKLVFDAVLEGLQAEGLVPQRGKQRLDSTHVLGLVRRMSSLECVRETIRLALEEIEGVAESRPAQWAVWWERYVETKLDYQATEATFAQKLLQAGVDAAAVLAWADHSATSSAGPQMALLRRVWAENYELMEEKVAVRPSQPTAAVKNPHDPEAQWATKSAPTKSQKTEWVGYKVQVAETVGEQPRVTGEPTREFVTAVVTQPATHSDEAGMQASWQQQADSGLEKASTLYVDAAYVSAAELAQAQAEDRELMGPAQPSTARGKGYRTEDFDVDVAQRRAVCPAGKTSTQCSRLAEKASGKVSYRFEWSWQCSGCAQRWECVGEKQRHRTLVVGEHHRFLQARRREQKTEAFRQRMKKRAGIEGTQSEMVRGHGMRRARYRGLAKVTLQNYLIGAACNVKRWLRHAAWEMNQASAACGMA
jgi:transposase